MEVRESNLVGKGSEKGEASKQPSNSLPYFYIISMSTSVGI